MRVIRVAILFLACTAAPVLAQDSMPEAQAIGEILSVGAPPVTDIDAALGAESLAALKQIYAARNDRPIWFTSVAAPAAHALLDRLAQPDMTIGADLQPLLDAARARIAAPDSQARAGADLLLTALYGATAQAMRPKDAPTGFSAALDALAQAPDVAALLHEPEPPKVETTQVEATKPTAPASPPDSPEVARLKTAIAALHDWPQVPDGPKLELGAEGPRVDALRRLLMASGDLAATAVGSAFDPTVKSALEHFQARHGLPADGVAGAATLAALNVSARARIAMLDAQLKRVTARDWGDRYLVVNIPAARYRLIDAGKTVAEGPAILGAPATPTPALDGTIDRVLLHPAWKIPQQYADRQLWPRQEEDATYFYSHGIHVTDDGLKQDPGAANPLGPAKLLIAGNDRIALHGAPARTDFNTPDRFTSSGCIALPEVAAVARPLLAADPAWPQGRIDGAFAVGDTQAIALAKPFPVHLVYDTAWVEKDGTVEFRDDIYGWDKQPPTENANSVADPCGS